MSLFVDKTVVILSPQPWNYLKISKHHYAKALAKNNAVYFVSAPTNGLGFPLSFQKRMESGVSILEYNLPLPNWFRFRFPFLYKRILTKALKRVLTKAIGSIDYVIDFGCYQQFDSVDFLSAGYKIYFPVDDFENLKGEKRGANLVITVSKNIQQKFAVGQCHYINHGLANEFVEEAIADKSSGDEWKPSDKIRIGYTGNLFIRFIDTVPLERIIGDNLNIEFHFFGSTDHDPSESWQTSWYKFLKSAPNVFLHGLKTTSELADEYNRLDGFLVSYKPDNKNYHAENSHKVMEYLSTGKVVVSTFISIYENTSLLEMAKANEELPALFSAVVSNIASYNEKDKAERRREFALANTYEKNLEKIAQLIAQS